LTLNRSQLFIFFLVNILAHTCSLCFDLSAIVILAWKEELKVSFKCLICVWSLFHFLEEQNRICFLLRLIWRSLIKEFQCFLLFFKVFYLKKRIMCLSLSLFNKLFRNNWAYFNFFFHFLYFLVHHFNLRFLSCNLFLKGEVLFLMRKPWLTKEIRMTLRKTNLLLLGRRWWF